MTAILSDFDTIASTPNVRVESPLQLPAAMGMGRAFLMVHCAPWRAETPREATNAALPGAVSCEEAVQAFVAELRELGGMAVVA